MDKLSQPRAWQLSQASVRGKSHVDNSLPNQDSVFVRASESGAVVCAVVSDGAGTAARSGEGSKIAAESIAARMFQIGLQLTARPDVIHKVHQEFEISIDLARQRIDPTGAHLREFHCTMVAWLCTPIGAFIAQIGDSVALSTRFATVEEEGARKVDFFPEGGYHLHEVDRGEYANETHFITEADWKQHLRVSRLPEDVDAVVLMTDGAMDVAMLRGQVFRGFLSNLLGKLISTSVNQDRHDTIHAWLDDRQTYGVTGDDKTIFVGVRQQQASISGVPVYQGPPQSLAQPVLPPTQIIKPSPAVPSSPERSRAGATLVGGSSAAAPVQVAQPPQRVALPTNMPGAAVNKRLLGALVLALLALVLALAGLGYVLYSGANSDAPKPSPQVATKERDNTPKHQTSIPTAPLPPDPVAASKPVAMASDPGTAASDAVKALPSKLEKIAQPNGKWLSVLPTGVIEFNKKGAAVKVRLTDGPDLRIKKILFSNEEIETRAVKAQCEQGTLLKAKGSACNLSVVTSETQDGAIFLMTIEMQAEGRGGAAIDKVISFRSNSVAPRTKTLKRVDDTASAPKINRDRD